MDFVSNDIKTEGVVKIRIDAVGGDLDRVACRYPASFLNEMARQLTSAIEAATGVTGVAESSVELVMMFAPSTYMEHISGNVTYRRLMLIDAVSAPRDFWVKWTRLEAIEGEYTAENILFELGEDVEQKVREKEYRYLLTTGKDKYHNSMGRKKVTEWRDVIKRAARRGELTKVESNFELAPETLELEERIADLLGKRIEARNQPKKEEVPYITPEDDEFARAMEKARLVVEQSSEESDADEVELVESAELDEDIKLELEEEPEIEADEPEAEELEFIAEEPEAEADEPELAEKDEPEAEEPQLADEPAEFDIFADTEATEDEEIEELEFEELDIFDEEVVEEPVIEETPVVEAAPIVEETPEEEAFPVGEGGPLAVDEVVEEPMVEEAPVVEEPVIEETPVIEEAPALEVQSAECRVQREEAPIVEETPVQETMAYEPITQQISIADRVADIRDQLETKIRLEYETRAREKAEDEAIKLRRELEQLRTESEAEITELRAELEKLRAEYEHLLEQTEAADLARAAEETRRRAEEAQLRAQIEAQLRAEAIERERLAEAARMAIEEQHRLEAENARIARQREEEERAEAERLRKIEEEKAIEAIRQAELERIRREEEEAKAKAKAAMPDMTTNKYAYTSKTVKLVFRRSVDPNITTRIQEIIKATVDYYGKDNVYLRIRATVPDAQTVILEFTEIPLEEMELLGNIIKILGNSGLGIAKAIID
ncbi:MAG: hypothetical protein IKJ25_04085 [Clostridia bacterium]|nr:hypothetical protein [Clostridia bacterium]